MYLGNSLIASETVNLAGTQPVFFLADHHGTISLATDAAGAILQNQRYAPLGLVINPAVSLDRDLGYERDLEIGLLKQRMLGI